MSDIDKLRKQLLPTERVNVAGGAGFDVRGLSLESILRIFRRHSAELAGLFDKLVARAGVGDAGLENVAAIGSTLLEAAPHIAAEIIAEASGHVHDEAVELFRTVSAAVQLDALEKIGKLTFTEEMPPKKVLGAVVRLLEGVKNTLIENPQP